MSNPSVLSTFTFTGLPSHLTQAPARWPTVIAKQGIVKNFNSIPPFSSNDFAEIGDEYPLEPKYALQLSSQPFASAAKNNSSPAMNNFIEAIASDKNPSPKSGHDCLSSSPMFAIRPEQDSCNLLNRPIGNK